MNITLPIKELNLSEWRDTMDISDPGFHYVITGSNAACGCINFLNEDASGEKTYYVTLKNCNWRAKEWHSALGFIVRKGHGTLRAHLEIDGESTLIGSNFPGLDVNGAHVMLHTTHEAKLNLDSHKNQEGLRIINGGRVDLATNVTPKTMSVCGQPFVDFYDFLDAATKNKPVSLGLSARPHERIMVLVNKTFENGGVVDGVRKVLGDQDFMDLTNLDIEYYCLERDLPWKPGESSSNSELKHNYLYNFLDGKVRPDFIFSVSTSESTYEGQGGATNDDDPSRSANGCVYVGNRFFVADCRAINKGVPTVKMSKLEVGDASTANTKYYSLQAKGAKGILALMNDAKLVDEINGLLNAEPRVPKSSAQKLRYSAGDDQCCVGVVNITNYEQYPIADGCAYGLFYKEAAKVGESAFGTPIGIETTHGVVRMVADRAYGGAVPVFFVSPITDRFVRFDVDVTSTEKETDKTKKQNYVCSYKGGVALGCMLKFLNENM